MMCCNNCPFNPENCKDFPKCDNPVCKEPNNSCSENTCLHNFGKRCFMDYYVIDHLAQQDELAEGLALETLRTALIGRDRFLLLSLFQTASEELRMKMWSWLEENETRSLWLLNPIFSANGLPLLNSLFTGKNKQNKYMNAIISNQNIGNFQRYTSTI